MNCIVTAGPTYEELDQVRRLTNFSTGKLGSILANFLVERGHTVTLFYGHYSTYDGEQKAQHLHKFTTTANLRERIMACQGEGIDAIFHAAAVSDFGFGKVYSRSPSGELTEIKAGKITTRGGTMLAELVPTPKILSELRAHFPKTFIAGWKYEVDGDRPAVLAKAEAQLADNKTNVCVANGPAYGFGFGVVNGRGEYEHCSEVPALFGKLEGLMNRFRGE